MSELLFEGLPSVEVTQGILIDLVDRVSMATELVEVKTAAAIALEQMIGVRESAVPPPAPTPNLEQTQNLMLDFFDRVAMGMNPIDFVIAAGIAGQELRGESDDPYPVAA